MLKKFHQILREHFPDCLLRLIQSYLSILVTEVALDPTQTTWFKSYHERNTSEAFWEMTCAHEKLFLTAFGQISIFDLSDVTSQNGATCVAGWSLPHSERINTLAVTETHLLVDIGGPGCANIYAWDLKCLEEKEYKLLGTAPVFHRLGIKASQEWCVIQQSRAAWVAHISDMTKWAKLELNGLTGIHKNHLFIGLAGGRMHMFSLKQGPLSGMPQFQKDKLNPFGRQFRPVPRGMAISPMGLFAFQFDDHVGIYYWVGDEFLVWKRLKSGHYYSAIAWMSATTLVCFSVKTMKVKLYCFVNL